MTHKLQQIRHQLSTPLALLLLYGDLLQTKIVDNPAQEWLENLQSTVKEMHTSLDRLTESPHLTVPAVKTCDLQPLFEHCLQELQPWIQKKQLRLVCHFQSMLAQVDAWKIRQVLQNLLSNAIAFSPIGGEILCEGKSLPSKVLITISDRGPGLSAEDLEAMWMPYYSRRAGGMGMGLAIAKQIILEHRGCLWADNLVQGGAQFCLTLPRSDESV